MKKDYLILKEEPLAGASFSNILRLLNQNNFQIHPKYWLRFCYALIVSTLCLPLRCTEFIRFHRKVKKVRIDRDPLFIIGHYRTGSTYLITLLSKDRSKGYVSNNEAYAPHFFLAFPKFTDWLLSFSLPEKRPMDDVIMGSTEPTEEEYAIGAADKYGFYNGFIFPKNFDLYSRYNSFEKCPERELKRWKLRYYNFVQKMTLKFNGKMMILKNPANSYRIPYLLEMFPKAKFIHLYRNPYEVFPSTLKFFREVFSIYALQTWIDEEMQNGILRNFRELYQKFFRDKELISPHNIINVRYEDFIHDPLSNLERIYDELDLEGFPEARDSFIRYIDTQKEYRPNQHKITSEIIQKVNRHWGFIVNNLGYKPLAPI